MFALVLSEDRMSFRPRRQEIISSLQNLPELIKEVLKQDDKVLNIAKNLYENRSILIMGRGYNFSTCLEGALKIKELTYMHCEGKLSKSFPLPCAQKTSLRRRFLRISISYFDRHPIWRVETWSTSVSRWNCAYCDDHYAWQCSHQMHECSSASDCKERETNHHVRERRHGRNNLAVLINNGKNIIVQFCHNTSNTFSIFRKPKNGQKKIVSLRFPKP